MQRLVHGLRAVPVHCLELHIERLAEERDGHVHKQVDVGIPHDSTPHLQTSDLLKRAAQHEHRLCSTHHAQLRTRPREVHHLCHDRSHHSLCTTHIIAKHTDVPRYPGSEITSSESSALKSICIVVAQLPTQSSPSGAIWKSQTGLSPRKTNAAPQCPASMPSANARQQCTHTCTHIVVRGGG